METKRVLYISSTGRLKRPYLDPSARYRCYNPARDLREEGWQVDVCAMNNFDFGYIDRYDLFVFHRPRPVRLIEASIDLLAKLNKPYLADFDDLSFGRKYALETPGYLSRGVPRQVIENNYEKYTQVLQYFDYFTTSNEELSKRINEYRPEAKVRVIHNGLDRNWVDYADHVYGVGERVANLIAYLPGTRSHNNDFKLVENVLIEYLNKNRNSILLIAGPLEFNHSRFPAERLVTTEAVNYKQLPKIIMRASLNLAPLPDNAFNRCKSALKFFESAAFGVPTVASPIPDYSRINCDALSLAKNEDDWFIAITEMLESKDQESLSKCARDYAMTHCLSRTESKKIIDYFDYLLA